MPHTPCSSFHQQQPQEAEAGWNCTLLNLRLPALEEVESIGGFRVYMLHYGEDVENVFLCEGGLVPVVKVVFLQQYLEEPKKRQKVTVTTFRGTWQGERKRSLEFCTWNQSQPTAHVALLGDSILKGP